MLITVQGTFTLPRCSGSRFVISFGIKGLQKRRPERTNRDETDDDGNYTTFTKANLECLRVTVNYA